MSLSEQSLKSALSQLSEQQFIRIDKSEYYNKYRETEDGKSSTKNKTLYYRFHSYKGLDHSAPHEIRLPDKLFSCSDRAISVYYYLAAHKEPHCDYINTVLDSTAISVLGLNTSTYKTALNELIRTDLLTVIQGVKPKVYCINPFTEGVSVYSNILEQPGLDDKSIAYYLRNRNTSPLPDCPQKKQLSSIIENDCFIDFAKQNMLDYRCDIAVETLIGREFFDDLTSPYGVAAMRLRDTIVNYDQPLYFRIIKDDTAICYTTLLKSLIDDNFTHFYYTGHFLYKIGKDPESLHHETEITNVSDSPNRSDFTFQFHIEVLVTNKTESFCICQNCHCTQETFRVYTRASDIPELSVNQTYRFRIEAARTYDEGYHYYLLSFRKTKESGYTTTIDLSSGDDTQSVIVIDNARFNRKEHILTIKGMVLLKVYGLTTPFRTETELQDWPLGYPLPTQGIKFLLTGSHYFTLRDGLNISIARYRLLIDDQKTCMRYLTRIIRMDQSIAQQLSPLLTSCLSQKVPDFSTIRNLLLNYYTDPKDIDQYLSSIRLSYTQDELYHLLIANTHPETIRQIYDKYALDSVNMIRQNPYLLVEFGITLIEIDRLAYKLGIPYHSDLRKHGILQYLMMYCQNHGNTAICLDDKEVTQSFNSNLYQENLTIKELTDYAATCSDMVIHNNYLVSSAFEQMEQTIARELYRLQSNCNTISISDNDIDDLEQNIRTVFDPTQGEALKMIG